MRSLLIDRWRFTQRAREPVEKPIITALGAKWPYPIPRFCPWAIHSGLLTVFRNFPSLYFISFIYVRKFRWRITGIQCQTVSDDQSIRKDSSLEIISQLTARLHDHASFPPKPARLLSSYRPTLWSLTTNWMRPCWKGSQSRRWQCAGSMSILKISQR